jgi:hypothetical protein
MASIVPKSHEPWTQEQPFRVEHFARHDAAIQRVYFEAATEALAFAGQRTSWGGMPCVVESRDMPATHEVRCVDVLVDSTLWLKRFGDIESARAEFERCRSHALVRGGRYLLNAIGVFTPIEDFSHKVN